MKVSAVIPTRGDVGIPVLDFPFDEIVVYDNSSRKDLSVFGRYVGVLEAENDVVFTQDDDCVLPAASIAALVSAYSPGVLVTNMPEKFRPAYPEAALVGFGAVFDRALPFSAFARYGLRFGWDDQFRRECDRVFTVLVPKVLIDVPVVDLPHASGDGRMWRRSNHDGERVAVIAAALSLRGAGE